MFSDYSPKTMDIAVERLFAVFACVNAAVATLLELFAVVNDEFAVRNAALILVAVVCCDPSANFNPNNEFEIITGLFGENEIKLFPDAILIASIVNILFAVRDSAIIVYLLLLT